MSAETLSAPFNRLELFEGLSPDQIGRIARHAERVVFQPGQPLIESGRSGDAAVLVVQGSAERTRAPGTEPKAEDVEPGSLVGEMAMLIETEHTSTVVARTQVRALRLCRAELHRLMVEDPTLADHFVEKISSRLRRLAVELHKIDDMLAGSARHH